MASIAPILTSQLRGELGLATEVVGSVTVVIVNHLRTGPPAWPGRLHRARPGGRPFWRARGRRAPGPPSTSPPAAQVGPARRGRGRPAVGPRPGLGVCAEKRPTKRF